MAVSYSLPGILVLPPDWGVEPGDVVTGARPKIPAFELLVKNSIPGLMRPARNWADAGASVSMKVILPPLMRDEKISALEDDPTM